MSEDHILSHDEIANMDTEPIAPLPEMLVHDWMAGAEVEREANAHLEGAAWFAATFDQPGRQLLQPLNETVNYAVVVQSVDPWTTEVAVEKYWKEPGGYLGIDGLTVETFASDDDDARERAEAARLAGRRARRPTPVPPRTTRPLRDAGAAPARRAKPLLEHGRRRYRPAHSAKREATGSCTRCPSRRPMVSRSASRCT